MRCFIVGGLVVLAVLGAPERPLLEDARSGAPARTAVDIAAVNRFVRHLRTDAAQEDAVRSSSALAVTASHARTGR